MAPDGNKTIRLLSISNGTSSLNHCIWYLLRSDDVAADKHLKYAVWPGYKYNSRNKLFVSGNSVKFFWIKKREKKNKLIYQSHHNISWLV